jgi:hypothetical protein
MSNFSIFIPVRKLEKQKYRAVNAEFVSLNENGTDRQGIDASVSERKERKNELPGPQSFSVLALNLDRVLHF